MMQKKYVLGAAVIAAVVAVIASGAFKSEYAVQKPILRAKPIAAANAETKAAEAKVVSKKDGPVAARVNGEVISVDEIRQGYNDNPQIAEQVPFNEFYEKAVDVFVNGKLLYQAATKAKVEDTPAYQAELKTAKEDLARKVFLEQAVEKKVTPEAVEAFYRDEYVSKFESKQEMGAKHILLDDEATAKEVIAKLNNGESFDALAEKYTKDNTVELGYFTADLMVPEFTKAAQSLKKGEYTKEPVKTQFGYHIILLTDVRESRPLPLSELEPQIKNILSQQVVAEVFEDLYKQSTIEKYDLNGKKIEDTPEKK